MTGNKDFIKNEAWMTAHERYHDDISAFSSQILGLEPTLQQCLLYESVLNKGSRTSVATSYENIQYSRGVVALWHLCFFPQGSMNFFEPPLTKVKSVASQWEVVLSEIKYCIEKMRVSSLSWMVEHIVLTKTSGYIKGHQKTWHVLSIPITANLAVRLAGCFSPHHMVWVDKASQLQDSDLKIIMATLTDRNYRTCMVSEPLKNTGFFHDTHHKLSMKAGGVWNALIFNSEDSPLVPYSKIREWLLQYGSRDDPQYMVRVRGEFPL